MRAQSLLTLVKNMRRSKGPIGTAWPQLHTQNCPTLSQIVCPPHLHLPLPLHSPPPCFVEPSTVSFIFLIFSAGYMCTAIKWGPLVLCWHLQQCAQWLYIFCLCNFESPNFGRNRWCVNPLFTLA